MTSISRDWFLDSTISFECFSLSSDENSDHTLDEQARCLLDLMINTPSYLDSLVAATGERVESVLGLITRLELLDLVYQVEPGRYQQTKK